MLVFCLVLGLAHLQQLFSLTLSNSFCFLKIAIEQLDAVVKELHSRSNKWPLVVLHNKRVKSLLENASNRKLLEEWIAQGVLYGTPHGSNDDWYNLWTFELSLSLSAQISQRCSLWCASSYWSFFFSLIKNNSVCFLLFWLRCLPYLEVVSSANMIMMVLHHGLGTGFMLL